MTFLLERHLIRNSIQSENEVLLEFRITWLNSGILSGQRFALMQIKVGLVKLLSSYKFEVTENTPKKPRCGRKLIIYTVRDGIPLKITRLEK